LNHTDTHSFPTRRSSDLTRKANEDAKVYYNGELQPLTSLPWAGSISYSGAWFAIGQQKDIDRPFNGLIDEVEIYNRALTADEIQDRKSTRLNSSHQIISY